MDGLVDLVERVPDGGKEVHYGTRRIGEGRLYHGAPKRPESPGLPEMPTESASVFLHAVERKPRGRSKPGPAGQQPQQQKQSNESEERHRRSGTTPAGADPVSIKAPRTSAS